MQKYFSNIVIAFFVVAGFVLLLTDKTHWPGYYDLPYMGWAALVCALVIFVVPKEFQAPLALVLFLNGLGDLGLYQLYLYGFEFDKVIHFVSPLIAALVFIPRLGVVRAALLVVGMAFAWELFEFLADTYLKTHLFGVYRHQVFRDTITDIAMNILGVAAAALYLKYKGKPATMP